MDNFSWKISDGTLTVSGTGAMPDYECEPDNCSTTTPWAFCQKAITAVVIENGITAIGNYAFLACRNLKFVTISNSVTSIGDAAFLGCSSLESIIIPDSVTSIGHGTFGGCSSLESITIPDSVTFIGHGTFLGCSSLESIIIPNSVISIEDVAFFDCSSLQSVTIPNSVKTIGKICFSRLQQLKICNYLQFGNIYTWQCVCWMQKFNVYYTWRFYYPYLEQKQYLIIKI